MCRASTLTDARAVCYSDESETGRKHTAPVHPLQSPHPYVITIGTSVAKVRLVIRYAS